MIAAYCQYKLTVIAGDRKFILDGFNKMLEMNGLERSFNLLDYDLRQEFEGASTSNDTVQKEGQNNENKIDGDNEQ